MSVREGIPIESRSRTMAVAGARLSLLVDSDGRLVGVLALDDVLELLAEERETIGDPLGTQACR